MANYMKQSFGRRNGLILLCIIFVVLAVLVSTIALLILFPPQGFDENYSGQYNVLFIVVDDLRPALSCYGDEIAVTPNIDKLAARGIIFKNAYVQQASDGPSRVSFLTSRRPDHLHLYDEQSYWRKTVGNFTTLPEHFKNSGYEAISVGQIFTHGLSSNKTDDFPYSWSTEPYWPASLIHENEKVCKKDFQCALNLVSPIEVENGSSSIFPDIESTDYAINYLNNKREGNESEKKFFLGVGYYKPHIPFRVPRKYFELYQDMDLAQNHQIHQKFPTVAWNPWTDIRDMDDVKQLKVKFPYGPVPEDFQKLIRQGYYAAVSYIDDQVGRLLEALEETGYAKNTAVVLVGDNGWSLGEHQEWSKHSNFEVAVNVPLIVYIPKFTDGPRRKPFSKTSILDAITNGNISSNYSSSGTEAPYVSADLVELVDLFPTVTEIANIETPPLCNPVNVSEFCSEGVSFYPVIEHIVLDRWIPFVWKSAAFSQYPRPSLTPQNNSDTPLLKDIDIMGYSIRTDRYRYTEWVAFDNEYFKADWPLIISRELYDHSSDHYETENLCDEENLSNTVIDLSSRIKKGWRKALPPGEFESL